MMMPKQVTELYQKAGKRFPKNTACCAAHLGFSRVVWCIIASVLMHGQNPMSIYGIQQSSQRTRV